ncbi:hypothetical protein [Paenibacillus mesotrionivorans]|uniref:Uncharacterized protein n=1 Tax=Paenibacillus mesotrionivorans TaxID=3160968 RepID=A0ACC7NZ20_9BACL
MDWLKDLSIHILGIIVGGLIAYRIVRWQFEDDEIRVSRKNRLLLTENIRRIHAELKSNLDRMIELKGIFHHHNPLTVEALEGGTAYVEANSFFAFHHLRSSSLYMLLPAPLEIYVYDSYSRLEWFQNNYRLTVRGLPNALESSVPKMEADLNELIHTLETNLKQMSDFL